jgi:hypothetical protein
MWTRNNVCNASIPPNARDSFRIHPFGKWCSREFLVHSPIDLIRRQREAGSDKRASRCGRGYFCGYSDSELREGSLIMLHQNAGFAVAARSAPTRSVGRPSRPARHHPNPERPRRRRRPRPDRSAPRGAKLTSSSVDPASAPHPLVSVQQRTDLLSFIWTSAGESGAPRRMEAPLSAIV